MVMFKAGACPLLRSQSSQDSSDAPNRRVAEGPAAWPRYACAPFPFPIPLPSGTSCQHSITAGFPAASLVQGDHSP